MELKNVEPAFASGTHHTVFRGIYKNAYSGNKLGQFADNPGGGLNRNIARALVPKDKSQGISPGFGGGERIGWVSDAAYFNNDGHGLWDYRIGMVNTAEKTAAGCFNYDC